MTTAEVHRLVLSVTRLSGDLLNLAPNVGHPDFRQITLIHVKEIQHILAGFVQDQTATRVMLDPYDREEDDDL